MTATFYYPFMSINLCDIDFDWVCVFAHYYKEAIMDIFKQKLWINYHYSLIKIQLISSIIYIYTETKLFQF